jgi:hypothetical protein
MTPKIGLSILCVSYLLTAGVLAQESGDSGPALGDVVRHQQERRQQGAKTAKKIVTDDDIPASRTHTVRDQVAEFVIIPAVRISGMAPNDGASTSPAGGQKQPKVSVRFGPHLTSPPSCYDGSLDCAEEALLALYRVGIWSGGRSKVLFDSDGGVQDFPARVVHFEVVHDVRGKMLGTAALIQTPVAILQAVCMYKASDQADAEPECDAFISSLEVNVPERYIYVEHH